MKKIRRKVSAGTRAVELPVEVLPALHKLSRDMRVPFDEAVRRTLAVGLHAVASHAMGAAYGFIIGACHPAAVRDAIGQMASDAIPLSRFLCGPQTRAVVARVASGKASLLGADGAPVPMNGGEVTVDGVPVEVAPLPEGIVVGFHDLVRMEREHGQGQGKDDRARRD